MELELTVEPMYLGPKLNETIYKRLIATVEEQCLGNLGYVICVTEVGK